jgi:hypothetical protein
MGRTAVVALTIGRTEHLDDIRNASGEKRPAESHGVLLSLTKVENIISPALKFLD